MNSRVDWFMKWAVLGVLFAAIATLMVGCNTVAGMGKDLQAVARGVQAEMTDDDSYGVARR